MKEILKALKNYLFEVPKYIRVNIPFMDFLVCHKLMEDDAYLWKKDAMKGIYDFYNMQLNEEYLDKIYFEKLKEQNDNVETKTCERDYYSF